MDSLHSPAPAGRLVLVVLAILIVGSCALLPVSPPDAPGGLPVRIARAEAVYENIHPSFWQSDSLRRDYALFLNVWVYLELDPGFRGSVREVRLYDLFDSYWTLPVDRARLREEGRVGGWLRLRDGFMSDNGAMLALRGMRVSVELSNGTIVTERVGFPPPASSTVDERFLVSEVYRGELTAAHAFALRRAEIDEVSVRSGTLEVVLGPVDRRATNGRLVFLDETRDLAGESPEFYNDISREPRPFLNDGARLRSDAANRVTIDLDDISWIAGASASDARFLYVKLRDGGQYAFTEESQSYLHLSRSALYDFVESAVLE